MRWIGRPLAPRPALPELVADAIVVLGAPLRPDGTLSAVGEERVRVGVELWRSGRGRLLCFSGGRAPWARHEEAEATAMARSAAALGVPETALRVESRSRDTAENGRYSAALLLPEGCRRVWLVTQPFHVRRAVLWFRRAGFEASGWVMRYG